MEELKVLVGMVADLPGIAIWVLIGFFAYKTIIVGSIYGVIKLAICKGHDAIVAFSNRKETQKIDMRGFIDGICITADGSHEGLVTILKDFKCTPRTDKHTGPSYIHSSDVRWLRMAIKEKMERENNND